MQMKRKLRSSKWDENDHAHICIAARLLEQDDFLAVCPAKGACDIEYDDSCDACEYLKILDFNSVGGRKTISIE